MKALKNILFILVGIVSIWMSNKCFNAHTGSYVEMQYYGGDAFTGIQHAAAETGENVRDLAKLVSDGFGYILLVSGLTLIVVGIPVSKKKTEMASEVKPIQNETPKQENA